MSSSIVIKGARTKLFLFSCVLGRQKEQEKRSGKNLCFNSLLRHADFIEKHKK